MGLIWIRYGCCKKCLKSESDGERKWILFPNEAGDCEDWVLYTTVEDMVAQHKVNMSKWQLPIIGVICYYL